MNVFIETFLNCLLLAVATIRSSWALVHLIFSLHNSTYTCIPPEWLCPFFQTWYNLFYPKFWAKLSAQPGQSSRLTIWHMETACCSCTLTVPSCPPRLLCPSGLTLQSSKQLCKPDPAWWMGHSLPYRIQMWRFCWPLSLILCESKTLIIQWLLCPRRPLIIISSTVLSCSQWVHIFPSWLAQQLCYLPHSWRTF